MPTDLAEHSEDLARQLTDAVNGAVAPERAGLQIADDPDSVRIVQELAGKQLPVDSMLLSFGSGNQYGDITFRDVAGRDIVNIKTGIQRPARRPRMLLAAVLIGLAILTIGGVTLISTLPRLLWPGATAQNTPLPTGNPAATEPPAEEPSLRPSPQPSPTLRPTARPTLQPSPTTIPTPQPVALSLNRESLDFGFVQWNDSSGAPGRVFTVRGAMIVEAYPDFAKIILDDGVYFIPWSRIIYIGSEEIGR